MPIYTKCIFGERESIDGLRASVMSRHTMNDGKTRNPDLDGTYDIHLLIFAPDPNLVGRHYRGQVSWENFTDEYVSGLRKPEAKKAIEFWGQIAVRQNLTFLCVEPYIGPKTMCHRIILAEEFQNTFSDLIVINH